MEVSINDITEVQKEIQIEASAAELAPLFEDAYKRYQPKIEIRGFRKGKVPLAMVKKIHGESIEYNCLDTIAGDFYRKIVEERDIHPIGEPVVTDMDYRRGETLKFKIKYEIKPSFELKAYKSLALEKLVHKVTPKEVEDEILRLRKANGSLVETDRVADDEHVVTADIQQLDETGSPLIGKKSPGAKLYLADETLFPEIRNALRDAVVGTSARVKVEQEHEGHKHADNLLIEVKKIEKADLPPLDEAFVKKITKEKIASVDEFRTKLTADLESYWFERGERRLADAMISAIVQNHAVTVPESMVRGILDSMIEEMKNKYPKKQLPPEIDEAKIREESHGYAVFQATWFLIREKIIAAESITAGDDDVRALAARDAHNVGIEEERLVEFYRNSPNVKERILSDKLIHFLRDHQAVTEKVTEEFFD